MLKFEEAFQNNIKNLLKPTGVKIDKHLAKLKTIKYTYDYGDNWKILITLENVVDYYYFGYSTLLDGLIMPHQRMLVVFGGFMNF